jgi:hypothetical protein
MSLADIDNKYNELKGRAEQKLDDMRQEGDDEETEE